ncbi:MAG: endonuclease/exonuclease/phosphatase family protein [Proteobacteria bacterium]|nr:endonuclease/exonuclease/phosphatase family protein [Pseudomonadota bacterium]
MSPDEPFELPPPPPEPLPEQRDPSDRVAVSPIPRTGGRWGGALDIASLAVVLGLVGVAIAGRQLRAPPAYLTVLVTFLPYLTLAAAVWAFSVWAIVPDRRLPPILLTVVVLLGAALWGPSWASRGEVVDGDDLRVMTWNVRRLWGGPSELDPAVCVAQAIAEESPDLVALLEVSAEDVEKLSTELGLHCVHGDYTGSGSRTAGGIATCVRTNSEWQFRRGWMQRFVDDEAWFYSFAEVERNGRVVNLLGVHLHPYRFQPKWVRDSVDGLRRGRARGLFDLFQASEEVTRGQAGQAKAVLERVDALRDATLIVGDFNSTRDAQLHAALRDNMTDAWERGGQGLGPTVRFAGRVPLRIDYIYASEDFAVRESRTSDVSCSDHASVTADLTLRP